MRGHDIETILIARPLYLAFLLASREFFLNLTLRSFSLLLTNVFILFSFSSSDNSSCFRGSCSQFHQHFMYNFYARRSRKRKKIQLVISIFLRLRDLLSQKLYVKRCGFMYNSRKSCTQNIDEIEPSSQFHRHFMRSFFAKKLHRQNVSIKKLCKALLYEKSVAKC